MGTVNDTVAPEDIIATVDIKARKDTVAIEYTLTTSDSVDIRC